MTYPPPGQQPGYGWQDPVPARIEGTAWAAGGPPQAAPPPRKRRRIFPWVFLAVQALFVVWVISAVATGGDIHSQAVAYCHAHPDQYLPFSQCVSDYGTGSKAGAAIGIGLIVVLWAVADVILGISYGVWRLARR